MLFCAAALTLHAAATPQRAWFNVSDGLALPVADGLSEAFIGVVNDTLVVAGGKTGDAYSGDVFILRDHGDSARWLTTSRLPQPMASGAAIAMPDGLLCIGGENAQGALASVFRLRIDETPGATASMENLPTLPEPLSGLCAARLGNHVYVTGGRRADGSASELFLRLALDNTASGWQRLPNYPAPPR